MYADWVYQIAERALSLCGRREIVLWGDYIISHRIEEILYNKYRMNIFAYVDSDLQKVDNRRIYGIDFLAGKKDKFFVIVPLTFHQSIKDKLKEYGYSSADYYYHNDCVIEDRNDYYEDSRGNRIIGRRGNIRVVFNGDNSTVCLGEIRANEESHSMYIDGNSTIEIEDGFLCGADIYIHDNVTLHMAENCTVYGEVRLMKNSSMSVQKNAYVFCGEGGTFEGKMELHSDVEMRIGAGCVLEADLIMQRDARLKLGEGCCYRGSIFIEKAGSFISGDSFTTVKNCVCSIPQGTSLVIGNDCMFSVDIVLFTNDGHSIFNVKSGKSVNSSEEERKSRKIIIGDHVWVGYRSMILYNTVIGNGSVIGAYSLVKGKIPNNCVAAGNPAKVVKRDIVWSRELCSEDIVSCGLENINITSDDFVE